MQDGGNRTVKNAVLLYYGETGEIDILVNTVLMHLVPFWPFVPGWVFVCVVDECGCSTENL